MKDLCADLWNFLGNVVLRNPPPLPPPSPTLSGKNFAFRKDNFEGALEWKSAQILEYNQKLVCTALSWTTKREAIVFIAI
jgi:hypothetical protein